MTGALTATLARAWKNPSGRAGIVLLGVMMLAAAIAPIFLPDPAAIDLDLGAVAPSLGHLFGTDRLGRDILSRVAHGGRVSLAVAGLAVALSLSLGVAVGVLAGMLGGAVDALLMRAVEAFLAIPRLFVLLLLLAVWDQVPLSALIAIIGLTGWFVTARLVRGEVLRLRAEGYVEAAAALGAGPIRTIFRHLVPNTLGVILVAATLGVGEVILLEAGVSFLGVGVRPPTPSWGGMVFDAMSYNATAPWMTFFPGAAIVITVLAMNLVSDALRGAFDPRSA